MPNVALIRSHDNNEVVGVTRLFISSGAKDHTTTRGYSCFFLLLSHYQLTIAIVNGRSDYLLEVG